MVDVDALVIGLALVGKAAVVSCFCSIFIYSSEIFPTVIRTVGVGSCTFFGRVGALSAPQLLLLVKNHYMNTHTVHILCIHILANGSPFYMSNDVISGRNSVQRSSTARDFSDLRCAVFHCQLPNVVPTGDHEQRPSGHRLPG